MDKLDEFLTTLKCNDDGKRAIKKRKDKKRKEKIKVKKLTHNLSFSYYIASSPRDSAFFTILTIGLCTGLTFNTQIHNMTTTNGTILNSNIYKRLKFEPLNPFNITP